MVIGRSLPEHVQEMFDIRGRFQFAMPPVGISVTRFQLGGEVFETHTARCDVEGCWMVYYKPDRVQAERFLDEHKNGARYPNGERGWPKCPSWPMRENLPSGLSNLEKLWNELDDCVDALMTASTYRDMEGPMLKGYAQGIAFNIVMLDGHFFKNTTEVSAHALDRRRMRLGEIPHKATPTRHGGEYTIHSSGEYQHSSLPGKKVIGTTAPAKAAPAKAVRAAPKPAADKQLTDQEMAVVKASLSSGFFTETDMAETYGITVEQVRRIVAA